MKGIFVCLLFGIAFVSGLFARTINLAEYEKKIFSQNGEDGVLEAIFNTIGEMNRYYVEFGTENGVECNTKYLREHHHWNGLLMDGGYQDESINLQREFITAENINALFQKYCVPKQFDLLSIDIDFNDWYVWHAIDSSYQPRVVVIEYNASHLPHEDRIVIYNPYGRWDGTNYFGASILALYKLGLQKGYSLVYANANGVNLFFIRNDIIEECKTRGIEFLSLNDVNAIYRLPGYGNGPMGGHYQDPLQRIFIDSSSAFGKK
jgi:hypothetical protein